MTVVSGGQKLIMSRVVRFSTPMRLTPHRDRLPAVPGTFEDSRRQPFLLMTWREESAGTALIVDPWFPARAPHPPARAPTGVLTDAIAVLGGDGQATPVPSTGGAEMIVHPTRWRSARPGACGGVRWPGDNQRS